MTISLELRGPTHISTVYRDLYLCFTTLAGIKVVSGINTTVSGTTYHPASHL
jgi:hypothetical protein